MDDYLTKPFDAAELLTRTENLVHQRIAEDEVCRKDLIKAITRKTFDFEMVEIKASCYNCLH